MCGCGLEVEIVVTFNNSNVTRDKFNSNHCVERGK